MTIRIAQHAVGHEQQRDPSFITLASCHDTAHKNSLDNINGIDALFDTIAFLTPSLAANGPDLWLHPAAVPEDLAEPH